MQITGYSAEKSIITSLQVTLYGTNYTGVLAPCLWPTRVVYPVTSGDRTIIPSRYVNVVGDSGYRYYYRPLIAGW